MSYKAEDLAYESGLPPGPRFVLVVLGQHAGDHSGEDFTCYPAIARIVEMTGYGQSTIEKHISFLYAEGWISREPRVRRDGTLGINDYVLHRDPEKRARLKADREGEERKPGRRRAPDAILKSRVGETLKSRVSNPQIEGEKSLNSRGQEPPELTSNEPPQESAREPGDEGFEGALAIWPDSGLKRTNFPVARARWAMTAQQLGLVELQRRVAACATDPQFAKGDHGWPALDNWLLREGWRAYPAAGEERPACVPSRTVFAGPAALRAAVVNARGEDFAASYLDRSSWRDGVVTAWSRAAFDKLSNLPRDLFAQHGAELRPNGGTHERAS